MLPSIPEELKTRLIDINPYFHEHLQNDFEDENRRRLNRPACFKEISNALSINKDKNTLQLKDIQIMKNPEIKDRSFELFMDKLFIKISLEIEQLMIEGKYQVLNNEPKNITPPIENGNILFVLDNVIIECVIPIHIEEDSFMANENFSMTFNPSQITTKKSWKVNDEAKSSETVESNIDQTLIKPFYYGLLDTILYLLHQNIGANIVEYSVTELFADEPEEMIAFSNGRIQLANKLIDNILQKSKSIKDKSSIQIPDLNLSFKLENSSQPSSISFKNGQLTNILNIKRRDTFAVNQESDNIISLSGGLDLRSLTMSFDDSWAKHGDKENSGSCKMEIYRTKLLFKALIVKTGETYSTKINNVQFSWIRDLDYDFTGLDCLSNIEDDIKLYLDGFFQGEVTPLLVNHLKEVFEDVLKDYDLVEDIKKC